MLGMYLSVIRDNQQALFFAVSKGSSSTMTETDGKEVDAGG